MSALENILSQEMIQRLGWTLVHFVWQGAVVAILLAVIFKALRKSSANLRYIIACLALALMVLAPVVTMRLVPVSVPGDIAIEPAPARLATDGAKKIPLAEVTLPPVLASAENANADMGIGWSQRAAAALEPALPFIVAGWLIGVLGLSVWHLGGWTQLQRLRRRMVRDVEPALRLKLKQLAQMLSVRRAVGLAESVLVQVPTVIGWLKPVILLPASALSGLSTDQLEAILAHELAHIKRCDYLVNMLQTVVEILGFYHPAVWWVSHKIRVERENCCDDLAVRVCGDSVCYAKALTSMEEIRGGYQLAVAAAGGNLLGRIRRLLGRDSANEGKPSWLPSVIAMLLITALVIPVTFALTSPKTDKIDKDLKAVDWHLQKDPIIEVVDIELEKRVESGRRLGELGKALMIYANEHEGKHPDSLQDTKPYLRDKQDLQWVIGNIEYLGKGKDVTISPQAVIAYDKTMLEKGKGTNVLFNDCHVEFVKPARLNKLGIKFQRETDVQVEGEELSATRVSNSPLGSVPPIQLLPKELITRMEATRGKYKSIEAELRVMSYRYLDDKKLKKELQFSREITSRWTPEKRFSKSVKTNYAPDGKTTTTTRIVAVSADWTKVCEIKGDRPPRTRILSGPISRLLSQSFNDLYSTIWDLFGWPWEKINFEESKVKYDVKNNLYIMTCKMGDSDTGPLVRLYVDPTKGFIPIKKEFLRSNGTLITTFKNDKLKQTEGGLWIPYEYNWFDPGEKFGAEYKVLEANVNKTIADEMFDFPPPKKTFVTDETHPTERESQLFILQLVDTNGNPVEGAEIHKHFNIREEGWGSWRSYGRFISGKGGFVKFRKEDIFERPHEKDGILLYAVSENKLAGFLEITPQDIGKPLQWQLKSACKVRGKLKSSALERLNQPLKGTAVYLWRDKYRPLSYSSKKRQYEFILPPGRYKLHADGASAYSSEQDIEIKAGQRELEVNFDLPVDKLTTLMGKPAPELREIKGWLNSKPLKLNELQGKVVLLDFWGYWCGPCISEMPELVELYEKFSKDGLTIIAIHHDSLNSTQELSEKLKEISVEQWGGKSIPFPIALDGGGMSEISGTDKSARGATTAAYGIQGWPTYVLIDRSGNVVKKFHPSRPDSMKELEKMLGVKNASVGSGQL